MITRLAVASAIGVLAAIIIAIAFWYLSVALALALEAAGLGAAWSALIVGVVTLTLALIVAGIGKLIVSSRRLRAAPSPPSPAAGISDAAAELGALLAQRLTQAGRSHPYGTVGTALVAGLLVGALPELRKGLGDLLKK